MVELYLVLIPEQQVAQLWSKKIVRKFIMSLLTSIAVVLAQLPIHNLLTCSCHQIYNFKDLTVVDKQELVPSSPLLLNSSIDTKDTLELT